MLTILVYLGFAELSDWANYSTAQRKRFLQEMDFFIQKAQLEQKSRLDGRILSLEEYWDIRMGTSAVGVIMAVNEWVIFPILHY